MRITTPFYYMPRKHLLRTKGDIREFPRYSISEAAFYVRIPHTTLHAWTRGQDYQTSTGIHRRFRPLISLADDENKLLSFYNLVEAHILRATTVVRKIPFKNVRRALDYVQETISGTHPLLTYEFETSETEMFIKILGQTINATKYGQRVMTEVLQEHLKLIPRDDFGMPIRIFPIHSKRLTIDPFFSSGKPIVRDKGITASVIWGRSKSKESIPEIAKDYGLTEIEVKETIEDYEWRATAA